MDFFKSLYQKKRNLIFALLILFTCLVFCRALQSCQPSSADTSFEAFTEELFRQELSSNTISLHYTLADPAKYNLDSAPVTFGEYSADIISLQNNLDNYIAALENFSDLTLSAENQLTYDILHSYLISSKEGLQYLLYNEPLSPVTGIHAQLPILLSEYQFYTKDDVTTYLQLLSQTTPYFDSILAFENAKLDAGIFMPDYQLEEVINFCDSFLKMGDNNYLYSSFEERLCALGDITNEEAVSFCAENADQLQKYVFPAYQSLMNELSKLKGSGTNEMGLCYFPDGKDYYEFLAQSETGISASVREMQEMTQNQIAEDLTSLEEIYQKNTSLSLAENSLASLSAKAMLDDLKAQITSAFPEISDVSLDIKYVSSAMEDYLSPAFYMIPAIDNTSENVIYINQGQIMDDLSLYTTLAHEGYPGHLYQTVYFSSKSPNPIRSILNFGGYVEGWATYTEMMAYYLAPISKTEAGLLQKNNSIILGLYAFADMGIHYDGWTLDDTVSFFSVYGIADAEIVQEIYELIIGSPANYLKYYLGYVKFYEMKKNAAEMLGSDFSQAEFHRAVLDVGPAPFDIVEEYVRETLY